MILRRRRLALTKEVEKPASSLLRSDNGQSVPSRIQALHTHSILQTCPVCRMNRPESYRHERHMRRQGHSGASSKHWQDTHAMPCPPYSDASASAIIVVPSERLQAAMQTDEKRGPSASQCASLANSIQPAWRQDTHAATLVCAPRACVQALSAASLASKSRAKDGFPVRYRLRHACPAVSLATVRQRVGSLAVGRRYIGGRAGWAPCWRAGVLLVGLHCTYTHISIVCFHTRKSPRATNRLLLIPTLRVQNPPLNPSSHSPTTTEQSQSQTKQTPPLLHRHSTSPHLPPPTTTTTMPRSYIADNSASRP